jgi:tetratricopeptide (TPR) repeat protein
MKTDDYLFPDDFCPARNDIYIDDSPVDNLLYAGTPVDPPTPADIVKYWIDGFLLTGELKQALVSVLVNKVYIDFSESKIREAESIIKEELDYKISNPGDQIKLLITLIKLKETHDHASAVKYYQRARDLHSKNESLLDGRVKLSWHELNRYCTFQANPFILRSEALNLVESGNYAEAENLYLQLIEMNFEIPGTLCHLARVRLLSGQVRSAEESVEDAWKNCSIAKKYVVPRIIFFKILFALIIKSDPSSWIGKMKESLNGPEACMEWYIAPLVRPWAEILGKEDHEFMSALAGALQSWPQIAGLDAFKLWNINK